MPTSTPAPTYRGPYAVLTPDEIVRLLGIREVAQDPELAALRDKLLATRRPGMATFRTPHP